MLHESEDIGSDSEEQDDGLDLLAQLNRLNIDDENMPPNFNDSEDGTIARASSKILMKSNPVFNLNRLSSKVKTDYIYSRYFRAYTIFFCRYTV